MVLKLISQFIAKKSSNKGLSIKALVLAVLFFFIQGASNIFAQITVTNPNITPAYAVTDVLLGVGVVATNITFNGSPFLANSPHNSVREFANTSAVFPLTGGVLMQTDGGSTISDPDLSAITTSNEIGRA